MFSKIIIIGCCGSGKSTLAKKIQSKSGLPLIHLDQLYYKSDWQKTPKLEWEKKVNDICNADEWIIDGNYISTLEMRAQKAELIVFLDINRWVCLYRAVLRVISPSKRQRADMAEGCTERHDWQLYRFIWNFNKMTKPRIIKVLEQNKDKKIYVLKSSQDIECFLEIL